MIVRASLQRPVENQILSFKAVEEFCKSAIPGTTFIVIDKEDMKAVRENLNSRYNLGSTVPGTRSCHHMVPTSKYSIQGKQLSSDSVLFLDHTFLEMPKETYDIVGALKKNDYITCFFDGFWWLALIESINTDEKDLTCKFMHPHGPAKQFYWPCSDDRGYIPCDKIIMKIATPSTSINGRQYFIKEDELEKTNNYFQQNN